ncbi:hypothetical protein CKM354_000762500 [Cercospora kikuchii]|uniref:G-patch domain-containing protein n=1 Tax=Cercospora kikuchii TaxID=84275 RepID=A0A9P3CJL4_9PEZI|nr:uncharacterized protein CKM354_000762500 [Cercospora kikuchii]GIZ44427.1 hypothetical protein CKM354_000762500 [Cercospora kikuchii]
MAEPAPKKGRLTLYEDLLSEESLAQMRAKDAEKQAAQQAKKAKDASLMFKPTNIGGNKRTQQKPAKKPNFSAMHKLSSSTSTQSAAQPTEPSSDAPGAPPQSGPKLTQTRGYEDWLANDEEMEWVYDRQQQERDQRKAKKKNKKKNKYEEKVRSWDDIYDPTVPVPIAEFARSDFHYDLEEEWKQRLYEANKREKIRQGKYETSGDVDMDEGPRSRKGMQFAPPGQMSFAPPPSFDSRPRLQQRPNDPYSGASSPRRDASSGRESGEPTASHAPPPPAADVNMEETADEAYARRMAMSNKAAPPAQSFAPPPPPPARSEAPNINPASASPAAALGSTSSDPDADKKARVAAQIAAMKAKFSKPAAAVTPSIESSTSTPPSAPSIAPPTTQHSSTTLQPPPPTANAQSVVSAPKYDAAWLDAPTVIPQPGVGGTISAAPTFNPEYLAQQQQQTSTISSDQDAQSREEAEERTNRPGQDGFAERLMKKLGWEKGQGLGASGDGITTALQMQAQKRKKKSDAQGGGFATPAAMGKIVGGKKAKPKPGEGSNQGPASELGDMSPVVKLSGMLENMDVDHEIAENNLMQEIGDEMGEQYGKVERLYIWRKKDGGNDEVFVKFTSPLSAVRCLKGMDGTEFADNKVEACYWDAEMFERGEYALP